MKHWEHFSHQADIGVRVIAEAPPGVNKDVSAVVDAADGAGLARKVARLIPLICIKG